MVAEGLLLHAQHRPVSGVVEYYLKAQPFWDPATFKFTALLEGAVDVIHQELLRLRRSELSSSGTRTGNTLDGGLVAGGEWLEYVFWSRGAENEAHTRRCPRTAELMRNVEQAISMTHGQVQFSILTAGGRLRPHSGATNLRLTAHLPLVVPEGNRAGIRVGGHERQWVEGQMLVFDDAFVHEAWNPEVRQQLEASGDAKTGSEGGGEEEGGVCGPRKTECKTDDSDTDAPGAWLTLDTRVILLMNFWHPELTEEDKLQHSNEVPRDFAWVALDN